MIIGMNVDKFTEHKQEIYVRENTGELFLFPT